MRSVEDIQAELQAVLAHTQTLRRELQQAREQAFGVVKGDIVRVTEDNRHEKLQAGDLLKVHRLEFWGSGSPAVYAYRRKKSGDWYQRPQYIGWGVKFVKHEDQEVGE